MKYNPIEILNVSLCFSESPIPVGRLIFKNKKIWFEYFPEFVSQGLELSPIKLPLQSGLIQANLSIFQGLWGVFDDSLPDGWGRLLLDRKLKQSGLTLSTFSPLDRLAFVGKSGMGALCYEPERMVLSVLSTELDLHQLAEESNNVLKSETAFFEELLYLNGSSCGARPKVSVCVSADKKHILQTPHAISNEFDAWLIKFPSSQDSKDIGAIEWAYHLMAKDAGLELPEAFLFSNQYFGSKRFDRKHNQRFHMHTLCGLLHADYRIPSLDYEDVLRAVYWLTKSYQELEKAYRLAVFNVLAHNRDDHSKNFSFLMNSDGKWRFAPAYDLVFSYGPNGEHSTTVMGEGKSPRIHHLLELTEKLNILNAQDVIDHVRESIKKWPIFAERAGVTRHSMLAIEKILKEINSPLPII